VIKDRAAVIRKLDDVFKEVFDDSNVGAKEGLSREQCPAWDSLCHIRLIGATEEAFGVEFTIEQIERMTSVDQIIDQLMAVG